MKKIAIVCGNVSTYHVPIYRKIEKDNKLKLTVLYGSDEATRPYYNKELDHTLHYKGLLGGYRHIFLKNYFENDSRRGFFSRINFGIFFHIFFSKYDYVLIYGYDTFTSWIAFTASILSFKKILWRGEAIDYRKNRLFFDFFKTIILKTYFIFFKTIFYSCEKNKLFLLKYCKSKKLQFFPCAVDNETIQVKRNYISNNREKIFKKFSIDKKSFKIIYAGRFTKRKNIFELINAFQKIINYNAELILVGNGPEFNKIKKYCNQNNLKVLLTGYLDHDDLFELYSVSSVFCICSSYDASPKVINEAMNFALPIIARNTIGTAGDLVVHNLNGFVYQEKEEFEKFLFKLISDKKKLKSFSEQSLKILNDKFNINLIVNNLYKSCQ
jgi:glycosyltransferase involved in cell wall biosynthesis